MTEIKNMIRYYDDKTLDTSCIGLRNCYRRFKLMYGDKVNFFIDSEVGIGTKIRIDIFEQVLIKAFFDGANKCVAWYGMGVAWARFVAWGRFVCHLAWGRLNSTERLL